MERVFAPTNGKIYLLCSNYPDKNNVWRPAGGLLYFIVPEIQRWITHYFQAETCCRSTLHQFEFTVQCMKLFRQIVFPSFPHPRSYWSCLLAKQQHKFTTSTKFILRQFWEVVQFRKWNHKRIITYGVSLGNVSFYIVAPKGNLKICQQKHTEFIFKETILWASFQVNYINPLMGVDTPDFLNSDRVPPH